MASILEAPFFQITIPLMFTFVGSLWVASWAQNKRFDDWTKRFEELRADMNRHFDEIAARLARIEAKLDNHEERVIRLEERTSPLR